MQFMVYVDVPALTKSTSSVPLEPLSPDQSPDAVTRRCISDDQVSSAADYS